MKAKKGCTVYRITFSSVQEDGTRLTLSETPIAVAEDECMAQEIKKFLETQYYDRMVTRFDEMTDSSRQYQTLTVK